MARLQDYPDVTPTSSDKLLVVQSTGQGLVAHTSKMNSANPTGTGALSLNRKADTTIGNQSVAIGYNCEASASQTIAEGQNTKASAEAAHSEGMGTVASGSYSHAEGRQTTASGSNGSHAEGYLTTASGQRSHAEGSGTTASGDYSHAEGAGSQSIGERSHAEGSSCIANAPRSHAEGSDTTASGEYGAHSEGRGTTASGETSHAEGVNTTSSGKYSHSEGSGTTSSGNMSHAEGYGTTANRRSQHVFGEFNVSDTTGADGSAKGSYIEIVGKGTSSNNKSNARTLDWSGNEVLAGDLTFNGNVSLTRLLNQYYFKSGSPIVISGLSRYETFIVMGFAQGIGTVVIMVTISAGVLDNPINMKTGTAFSNSHLTFTYSSTSNSLTITSDNASESRLTVIRG